jgi:hypothetical protein
LLKADVFVAADECMVLDVLSFERLLPPRRDRAVAFDLPDIQSAADARAASSAVLTACAAGTLSPGEAANVMSLIQTHLRAIELTQIEAGMTALEKSQKRNQP